MDKQDKQAIVEELDRRIDEALDLQKYAEVCALEDFKDWFVEQYIF